MSNDDFNAAFDELIAGKWRGVRARDLKAGDLIRAQGGQRVKLTGVYPVEGAVYITTKFGGDNVPSEKIVLVGK